MSITVTTRRILKVEGNTVVLGLPGPQVPIKEHAGFQIGQFRRISMLTVPMVGATFRPAEAKEIIRGLSIGEKVQLQADPNNEYDATAVAVYSDDVHIGFIPKESNSALFAVLMDGAEISAEIIAFESTLKPVLEIHFDRMPADEDYALEPAPDGSTDGSFEQYED